MDFRVEYSDRLLGSRRFRMTTWLTPRTSRPPVLFRTGEQNHVFRDSNILCHQRLEKIVPGRYELGVFPKYGYQDVFMGKNVYVDIFPRLLQFPDKHRN